ncbi:hypothetical protein AB4Z22_45840, partial [Paenibacillus sp. TAF58]
MGVDPRIHRRDLPGGDRLATVEDTLRHVRRAIGDPEVRVLVIDANEPSPVSPTSGPEWESIRASIAETCPEAIVS